MLGALGRDYVSWQISKALPGSLFCLYHFSSYFPIVVVWLINFRMVGGAKVIVQHLNIMNCVSDRGYANVCYFL